MRLQFRSTRCRDFLWLLIGDVIIDESMDGVTKNCVFLNIEDVNCGLLIEVIMKASSA